MERYDFKSIEAMTLYDEGEAIPTNLLTFTLELDTNNMTSFSLQLNDQSLEQLNIQASDETVIPVVTHDNRYFAIVGNVLTSIQPKTSG